jgi:hypothetical protein
VHGQDGIPWATWQRHVAQGIPKISVVIAQEPRFTVRQTGF